MSVEDVLWTSADDVPWRYIEDHITSSGRNFAEWDDFKCNVQEHHFVHFYEVIISCYPNFMTFFYFPFDFVISNNSHCQLMDLFKRKENFKEKVDSDNK